MSIKFYMDEHVAYAITKGLKRRGVNVLTVQEDGRMSIADNLLLDRATELERVVFTQDDDFLKEAAKREEKECCFAGIVYAHQENIPTGKCIEDLELIAKVYDPKDMQNRVEYLPL